VRTFPHIWRRKNNKRKEHNTMIWTWLWNLLCTLDIPVLYVIIAKTTPLGFSWPKRREEFLISLVWLSNCNMVSVSVFKLYVETVETNFETCEWSHSFIHSFFLSFFPYLESYYETRVGCVIFLIFSIFYFLGYSVMGKPFWGRAKGPYWIPFFAPTTDHLHQKNRTNTLETF